MLSANSVAFLLWFLSHKFTKHSWINAEEWLDWFRLIFAAVFYVAELLFFNYDFIQFFLSSISYFVTSKSTIRMWTWHYWPQAMSYYIESIFKVLCIVEINSLWNSWWIRAPVSRDLIVAHHAYRNFSSIPYGIWINFSVVSRHFGLSGLCMLNF